MKKLSEFLNEKVESKSQRRLFGMALVYKKGELDDNDVSDEIIKLSELPEKELKDFAETKEDELHEKVDESILQVKRKYGKHDSISVGANAPVRQNVLGFISENGHCTKDALLDFIKSKNEDLGRKTSKSWLSKNKRYIVEFQKDGCTCCKLSKLGQRVMNKTNINEHNEFDNSIYEIQDFINVSSKVIYTFIDKNNLDVDKIDEFVREGSAKDRIYAGMIIAGFTEPTYIDNFIKKFNK